ncbi:MAG: DEAD/DEAH box helicase, partial [Bacteroidetes bacterium GWA2_31_9]
IILCPTRELCVQISKDMMNYSKFVKNFKVVAVYGGASINNQIKDIDSGCSVVVGTPGRTLDLIKRKRLVLKNIKWVILDEADEMLSMGFEEDLKEILATTPTTKQTLLYSATMPKEILVIAKQYMNSPVDISAGQRNVSTNDVSHAYYMVQAKDRYLALKRLVDLHPDIYSIIFCRTRRETKEVAEKLMHDGYSADALHGDLSQEQRDYVMNLFRAKQIQLLIATDVAARGLDVNDLTHVINYNLPDEDEIYIHRSGRTGRAGKKGDSLTIIHSRELGRIRQLEKRTGQKIEFRKIPSGKEICEKQLFKLVDVVENIQVNESQIEQFLPVIFKKLEWLTREQLIKHFVSVEFNRFLNYYKDAKDINVHRVENERGERGDRGERNDRGDRSERRDHNRRGERNARNDEPRDASYDRLFINIGSKDGINPKALISFINQNWPGKKVEFGKIDIMKPFSFFEVEKSITKQLMDSLKKARYNGNKITVDFSQERDAPLEKDFKKVKRRR